MPLERSISLRQATIYGIGVIVGAGIYALIGSAAGLAGGALWLGFVVAGIIATLTAFSYCELTSRYPKEAAESVYLLKAFRKKGLAFFVGYLSLICSLFSVATVAWGFATYFRLLLDINPLLVAMGAICIFGFINFLGIQESIKASMAFTFLSVTGLVLLIVFGLRFVGSTDLLVGFSGEVGLAVLPGVFAATALIFFAYLGFEEIANITEEMKGAKKNAPKAILVALTVTTILYILISIVSVSVVPPAQLAAAVNPAVPLTQGPLALVADAAIAPGAGFWISLLALAATSSTMLALLIVSSRIIYGLSEERLLPKFLSKVNPWRKTPHYAILVATAFAIVFTLIGNIETLGNLTTVGTFLLFFMVNASLVAIRLKEKTLHTALAPLTIKRVPLLALAGAGFCLFMFLTQYWTPITIAGLSIPLILLGFILFVPAWPIYKYFNHRRTPTPLPLAVRKFAHKKN